jgi:hypothetical protein
MNRDTNRGIGSFATKAPRQTMIRDEPHMLAYINPQEEQMLRDMGGSGEAGPDGIPAYAWWNPSTWGSEDKTENDYGGGGGGNNYDNQSALKSLGTDLAIGFGLASPETMALHGDTFKARTKKTFAANEKAAEEEKKDQNDDDTSYTAPILSSKETLPSPTNAAVEDTTPVPRPSANFAYGYLPAPNSLGTSSLVPNQIVPAANGEGQQYTFEELLAQFNDPYAVGMSQGGSVPKQTMIGDQPHMLAYINPEEEQTLRGMGGSGMPGPGGVPAYHIPPPDELSDIVANMSWKMDPEAVEAWETYNRGDYGSMIDADWGQYFADGGLKRNSENQSLYEATIAANQDDGAAFRAMMNLQDPNLIYSQSQFDANAGDPNLAYTQEQFDANAGDPNLIYSQEQFEANAGDPNLAYTQEQFDANAGDPNLAYTQEQFDANAGDPNLIYSQSQFDDIERQDPNLIYSQSDYDANAQDPNLIYSQSDYDANAQDPNLIYSQADRDSLTLQDPNLLYTQEDYDAVNDPYQTQTGLYNTQTGLYNDVLGNYDTLKEDYAGKVGELNTQTGLYNTQTDLYNTQTGKYNDLLGTHGDYSDLDYSNLQDDFTAQGELYTGLQTDYDKQGVLLGNLQKDYDEIEGLYEGVQEDYLNKQVLANSSGLPTNQQNPVRPASINPLQAPGTSNIVMPASYGNAGSYTFQELLDRYVDPYARGS